MRGEKRGRASIYRRLESPVEPWVFAEKSTIFIRNCLRRTITTGILAPHAPAERSLKSDGQDKGATFETTEGIPARDQLLGLVIAAKRLALLPYVEAIS